MIFLYMTKCCNLRDQLGIVVFILWINALSSVIQELLKGIISLTADSDFVLTPNLNAY